ncbi:MAG TPA: DAHL domain-containing protein [Ramlibacter sp.]|nr:DAHL domain-containing protein [Ramlibacter sp.]
MTQARGLGWLPIAAVTALLVSVLAFLYARMESVELDHFEHIALLRHVKQLDAQWELDVLKSRVGIHAHYDALSHSLAELSRLLEELEADAKSPDHRHEALAQGVAALQRAIQQKAVLIEDFKSNNSLLRNSLAFLPTAAQDVQQSIRGDGAGVLPEFKRTSDGVNKLLLANLLFSQAASSERAAEIQIELKRLEPGLSQLPPAARERLDIFSAHVRTILQEQKVVDELLNGIAAVPTAARIDEINNLLSAGQQRAAAEHRENRTHLLAFSAVLVGLLLWVAARLVRSHAEINRVNRALQGANDNLEQRVQERSHELQQAQSELLATARQAGMAEIATNVLHNVGNVLNSVNVSAALVGSTLRKSRAQGLSRAVHLMEEHASDLGHFLTVDEKGKLLPGYLSGIAQTVAREHQTMQDELNHLARSIDHIKDVVALQQSYARGASFVEPVQICDLVEDAVRMNGDALARHRLTVVKEFAQVPEMLLDRARVLQILVNLISNAQSATQNVQDGAREITLRVKNAGGSILRVSVEDQGEGILAENLTRIFSHGFTTRKTGHGFGLHSCALAAKQMGGTLTAHSDGPGQGATFTLALPINTMAPRQ